MNHFVQKPADYKRDINILEAYHRDSATYISKMTGRPFEECLEYVIQQTARGGKHPMHDPDVLCLSKEKEGERTKLVIKFSEYLQDVIEKGNLLSPTLAVYLHPNVKRSLLAKYISGNIKRRGKYKKEGQAAKMAGDLELAQLRENQQTTMKVKNNALSGAHASNGTPLANKSSHSTLTSTCRSATGYGNANNEKFLFGNRHYWMPDLVKTNIISIITKTDLKKLQAAMDQFGIRYPTKEETMACITYSTDLYWRNSKETTLIWALVDTLSDIERAAFVYVGDMYHLALYNRDVVHKFLGELALKATEPVEDPDQYIKSMDGDMVAFIGLLCEKELDGTTISTVREKVGEEAYRLVAATAKKVRETLDRYAPMIKALWVTDNVPASVASLPTSIRRGAITSDTDSTIFTVQYWTEWFVGKLDFSEASKAIMATTTYLTSQTIIHVLAKMTANMGVIPSQIHQLAMKNEYAFPVFGLTPRAKHYYAYRSAQEGNVFKEFETEIKGVYLKTSKCPPHVMKKVQEMIHYIMDSVISGEGVSMHHVLGVVAGIENDIRNSVESGSYEYLTSSQVKTADSYKNPMSSPYAHYLMWEEVFAEKYGHTEAPTYSAIKVSVDADNRTKLQEWVDRMPDRQVAERFRAWLDANMKSNVTALLLPENVVSVSGVPREIICGIDIRKLIYETVNPFYLVLESIGLFMVDDNNTRLVSDYYK